MIIRQNRSALHTLNYLPTVSQQLVQIVTTNKQTKTILIILTLPWPNESMVDSSSSPEPVKGTMCCLEFHLGRLNCKLFPKVIRGKDHLMSCKADGQKCCSSVGRMAAVERVK